MTHMGHIIKLRLGDRRLYLEILTPKAVASDDLGDDT